MESRLGKSVLFCTFILIFFIMATLATQVVYLPPLHTIGEVNYTGPLQSDYLISLGVIGYDLKNGTSGEIYASASEASTVFNWAIGNLSNGGTVEFDVGQYNFSTYVDLIYSGITIVGQGRDSVIFAEDNMNTWILLVTDESDVHFFNFRIEGNKENQHISDWRAYKGDGIFILRSSDVSVEQVEANNCWARGVHARYSSNIRFANNIAHDNGKLENGNLFYDNYIIGRSDNVQVVNNIGVDPWMDNIVIYGSSNALVYNNSVSGTRQGSGSGVVLDGDSLDQTSYVTVRDNVIYDTGWGITGYNFQHVVIENNDISVTARDGIGMHYLSTEYIIDVVDVTIVNNKIQDASRNGIQIDSHNRGHIVRNNTISNIEDAAIRVESADDIQIWNNTISYACTQPSTEGEGAIYLKGSPSQIDIQSNSIVNTASSKPSVFIDAGSQGITVMHNHITEPIANNAGSQATIDYNWKVGYETFPNGQISYSFAHGFGGDTPVNVEIIWISDIGSRTWNWAADSTYITVTLSSGSSGDYDFELHARNWS